MKLLCVINIGGNISSEIAAKRQSALFSQAYKLGYTLESCVYGENLTCEELKTRGFLGRVNVQNFKYISANQTADELSSFIAQNSYDGVIIAESELSNDVSVLLAAYLNYNCLTNVCSLKYAEDSLSCTRFVYNNNMITEYKLEKPFVVSLKNMELNDDAVADVKNEFVVLPSCGYTDYICEQNLVKSAEELSEAKVLLAAGMGVKTKKDVEKIRNFAQSHGFGFGVTRPIAMRGWARISEIIGVSGSILSPEICVTIGVSGSAAFYAGIEKSRYILSVNSNSQAPIAVMSDDVIVDDYENVIDSLFSALSYNKTAG